MPKYDVALRCGENHVWWTTVPCRPREFLTKRQLSNRARGQALRAFGEQARTWPLSSYRRRR